MDPITGIGLVASVVQLVTFGIDTVKTCLEMYQQGSISEYNAMDDTTGRLASLSKSLQQSLQSAGTRSLPLSSEEKALIDLGRKCEDCANKLQEELPKLQTPQKAPALVAMKIAVQAKWKRRDIEKIHKDLQTYQSTLETSLLLRLSKRFDTQILQNNESFANLDRTQQHIITCLANSQTSLNNLVVQELEQTREWFTAQVARVERLQLDDRRYEEIMNSLFYSDIFSRKEQVDDTFDGIENSYDWVFDEPQTHDADRYHLEQRVPEWGSFAYWLKVGHGVYWMNGKAGSGKSTIMNHVCGHKRKLELLEGWRSGRLLLTPTFFFWNAGSRLQKSIDGLLRSLIYQMLKDCRELIGYFANEPMHTWTQKRLVETLHGLLTQSQVPIATCMFIDGLDEFEGQEDTVIRLIESLADQSHVKVCLSSRPLLAFEEAFGGCLGLKVQDLTFGCISQYAELQLSEPVRERLSLDTNGGQLARTIIDRIAEKADGVFLWAIIAVRNAREGLRGMANLDELAQAIETLPSEVESLFMRMLNDIKRVFKRDAARFLGIMLHQGYGGNFQDGENDLCRFYFITSQHSQPGLEDAPFTYDQIPTEKLILACHLLRTQLRSHTAGLLDITPTDRGSRLYANKKDLDPILFTRVNFLHRTVRDFLADNNEAKSFLALHGQNEVQVSLSVARGIFAQITHFSLEGGEIGDRYRPNPVFHPFRMALRSISVAEKLLGVAPKELMRSLDYKSLARRFPATVKERFKYEVKAYMIKGGDGVSVDVIGMAAEVGMKIHVCEQLGLPIGSGPHTLSLPDLESYSKSIKNSATLCWDHSILSQKLQTDMAVAKFSSNYRRALGEYLQWKTDAQPRSDIGSLLETHSLAETYMLSCCGPACLDLVPILLAAGANPMVQVELTDFHEVQCFWERWLKFLIALLDCYMSANGKSGGLMLRPQDVDAQITLKSIWDTTKALLAMGAEINYKLRYRGFNHILKRRNPDNNVSFSMDVSAMYILEECFNAEPEFRTFANGLKPLIKTPAREIYEVVFPFGDGTLGVLDVSIDDGKHLLSLIEKWEDTGSRDDLDMIQSAVAEIVRDREPGIISLWRGGGRHEVEEDEEDVEDVHNEGDQDDDEDNEDNEDNTCPKAEHA